MKTEPEGLSIPEIAERCHANRVTVEKYLQLEGIKPIGRRGRGHLWPESEAIAVVQAHQKPIGTHNTAPNIDPETGLTWSQKEAKEKARKLEMENDRAAKLLSEEIMLTSDHHRIMAAIVGRIEQVPGKVGSEQGLGPAVILAIRKALDEARQVAAKEVEEME